MSESQSSGGGYGGSGGGVIALYGPTIRDRMQVADLDTLRAYKAVGQDLLANYRGGGDDHMQELREALTDLDRVISDKGG